MRCTRGQSLSTHTGIQRLNLPPSARSQIGDIKQGSGVFARPSVNAAPHIAPKGSWQPRRTRTPPALGTGPEPSYALPEHRPRGLPAPLPLPDGLRLRRAGAETRGKGSPRLGKRLARPAGSLTALTCRLHGAARGLGADRETQPGAQRGQHRSGARESAIAA